MTSRQGLYFFIQGLVSVSQPNQGKSEVAISRRVTLGDFKKFGEIIQTNWVPSGALNNRWGRLAFAIAKAELAGIERVVTRDGYRNEIPPSDKIPIREKTLGDSES